jgi:biotin synthase-like enzyme
MLATAGLDYYNHNPGNAPDDGEKIITTPSSEDRLDTLAVARLRTPHSRVCPSADRSGMSAEAHG